MDFPNNIWGFLLSSKYAIVKKVIKECCNITSYCKINATTTASEADHFHKYISENISDGIRLINTGTIDPYVNLWGSVPLIDKGCKYLFPMLPNFAQVLGNNRMAMYNSPKIIISKMAKSLEAYWDMKGEYASMNTNCMYSIKIPAQLLMGWIHSKLFHYIYECYFEGLKMSGGYLPFSAPYLSCMSIPSKIESRVEIIKLVDEIIMNYKSVQENQMIIDKIIFQLCHLTYDEVLTVDPDTKITREEYEEGGVL